MKLKDMGEFVLINHLTQKMRCYDPSVILGIGDDAAALRSAAGRNLVVTSDMLVEGQHFRREWATPQQLGHKALAVSLSDIAAMGGTPRYALVSAGWPPDLDLGYAEGVYGGIGDLAAAHGVFIIGGDTVAAPQIILDLTVIGEMEDEPVARSGARPGHLFAVTGFLGASSAGLALLRGQLAETDWAWSLVQAHLLPQPRLLEAALLLKAARPSAMIDISDGLASELHHICSASAVGAEIMLELLPVSRDTIKAAQALKQDWQEWALYGGEDYELLLSLPPQQLKVAQQALRQHGTQLTVIGKVVEKEKGVKLLYGRGNKADLLQKGHDHFSPG